VVFNGVPFTALEVPLAVLVPEHVFAECAGLIDVVDVLNGGACVAPHHAPAPAVGAVGFGAAGVVVATAEAGKFAALREVEIWCEANSIREEEVFVGVAKGYYELDAAFARSNLVG
jgi:hypothetical protein